MGGQRLFWYGSCLFDFPYTPVYTWHHTAPQFTCVSLINSPSTHTLVSPLSILSISYTLTWTLVWTLFSEHSLEHSFQLSSEDKQECLNSKALDILFKNILMQQPGAELDPKLKSFIHALLGKKNTNQQHNAVRSPDHGNVIFGIKYCPNSPGKAIVVIITCASLCSCGLKVKTSLT